MADELTAVGSPCISMERSAVVVGAGFAASLTMASRDRPRPEQIRDLIEEVDRVRGESERMRGHADRAMKSSFWPERRRTPRFPSEEDSHKQHPDDT